MFSHLYIEVNVLCILVLAILVVRTKWGVVVDVEGQKLSNLSYHAMLVYLLDVVWNLMDGASFEGAEVVNSLVNAGYFAQVGVLCFLWVTYAVSLERPDGVVPTVWKWIYSIPMLILAVLSVSSVWTGLVFYIDAENHYHRGPLLFLQVVVVFIYLAYLLISSLRRRVLKKNFAMKEKLNVIIVLGTVPCVGQVFQLLIPGSSFFCICSTFALMVAFLGSQNRLISVDALTRLNNRNQLTQFLDKKMNVYNDSRNLFLFMMDVDNFKYINDTYGHVEGDRALLLIADAIKKVFGPKGHFLARFGGDEFVVIAEVPSFNDAEALRLEMNLFLEKSSKSTRYPLTVSIGIAERKMLDDNIPDLFNRADKDLYKVKREKKVQERS